MLVGAELDGVVIVVARRRDVEATQHLPSFSLVDDARRMRVVCIRIDVHYLASIQRHGAPEAQLASVTCCAVSFWILTVTVGV